MYSSRTRNDYREYAVPDFQTRPESPGEARFAENVPRWRSDGHHGFLKPFLFAGKLFISAACFWYVFHQVDLRETLRMLPSFDFRWAVLAVTMIIAQFPLLALRFQAIVQSVARGPVLTYAAANAVTAIYALVVQVLPSAVGEGIRAWMLTRLGCGWRVALTSVIIDRGVGVAVLISLSLVILLLPSPLNVLAGYRNLIVLIFGGALLLAVLAVISTSRIAPLLQPWRYFYWIGALAVEARQALLGPRAAQIFSASCLVHALTIFAISSLSRAQGLSLSVLDCAVLFTIMVGVGLVPISIGGWGLREFIVVSLLGKRGLAPEQALLFSLCFGSTLVLSALPGGIVWLLYPLRVRRFSKT